jgi:hypothetical protein
MATSPYFNNYNSQAEQRVYEDLIVESIKIMGFDGYYLPNNNDEARDLLYGEDPVKKFQSAFPIEFYLSNVLEYGGEKEFFSKFGLEIKNEVSVIVSKRSFAQRVPSNLIRPREGDLIYVPFLNGTGELYEIKFADQDKDFHQLGRKIPFFYELNLEKFKYSQELIDTGISDIDQVMTDNSYSIDLTTSRGTGTYELQEVVFQTTTAVANITRAYANATTIASVKSWIPSTNTLSVIDISGEFVNGQNVIGYTSNARYTLSTYDPLNINVVHETYDNLYIKNQANSIIDFSETNPFGSI